MNTTTKKPTSKRVKPKNDYPKIDKIQRNKERTEKLAEIINSDLPNTLESTIHARASSKQYSMKNTTGFVAQSLGEGRVPILVLPYSTFGKENLKLTGAKGMFGWVPIQKMTYSYPGISGTGIPSSIRNKCDELNIEFKYDNLKPAGKKLSGYNIEASFFDVQQSPDWNELTDERKNEIIDKYTQTSPYLDKVPEDTFYEALKQHMQTEGLVVVESSSNVNTGEDGYHSNGKISIFRDMDGASKLETLIHEYTHYLLRETDYHINYASKRALAETIVQSATHIVLQDLTTNQQTLDNSIKYIHHWAKELTYDDEMAKAFNDINSAVNTITSIIEKNVDLNQLTDVAVESAPPLTAKTVMGSEPTITTDPTMDL